MHIILFNEGQSARGRRFLLWAQCVRDDAQTGRPNTIRPALALANIGAQPGFVVINAFLRTKALERSPVPHQAELPMAVSAVIFHNFLSESHLRPFCPLSLKKPLRYISTSGATIVRAAGAAVLYKTLRAQTCATSNGNSCEESDTASWMLMSVIKITIQLYLTIYGALAARRLTLRVGALINARHSRFASTKTNL